MERYRIEYSVGSYDQRDIPLRRRLRDDDVRRFLLYWLQAKVPTWIARQFTTEAGTPLSYRMVYRHAERLAASGHLAAEYGRAQPDWRAIKEGTNLRLTATITGRQPAQYRGAGELPKGLRPHRGGPQIGTARRGRPAGAVISPEDMLRGVGQGAIAADGVLVVPYFDPDARPPGDSDSAPPKRQRRKRGEP
jgi:hypothetical protein